MANVTVIPARRQVGNSIAPEEPPKLRVAAYCRVSTDSDEQATSYEAQIEHYTEYIQKNPTWVLAGVFADDGISGTNTKKRTEFNRMIDECMAGKIDMIITKSISRFARNTLDCLKYIRQLKEKNIPVVFEKENINTMDAKGEVLLTIMASLAQQESQSLSQNVRLGLQYRYQQGKVNVNCKRFLGYTKNADGDLVIVPEEAEVVKRIYREYLEGSSITQISKGLEHDGILTGAGKPRWHTSTIDKILRNEKYIGDALLQKTYTVDYLSKKRVKNNGAVQQYYVEDHHEAIIPKDLFMLVQEELVRRRVVHTEPKGEQSRGFSANHCFANIVFCGECGEIFRRIHWNNRGCKSIVWRCVSRLQNTAKACHARTVNELLLQDVAMQALNRILGEKDEILTVLQENIAAVVRESTAVNTVGINERLEKLQQELIDKAHREEEYNGIVEEIVRLRDLKQQSEKEVIVRDEQIRRITELQDFISQQPGGLAEFDEKLVRRLVARVTVHDGKFAVELKSGVTVEIEG